jgi:hypothetical protein
LGHLPDHAVPVDAGIADHDVESAELLDHGLHHPLGVGIAADVGLDGQSSAAHFLDLADHLRGFGVVAAVVDSDAAALPGQPEGNGRADAETAAGDDGVLTFESEIHDFSPAFSPGICSEAVSACVCRVGSKPTEPPPTLRVSARSRVLDVPRVRVRRVPSQALHLQASTPSRCDAR